MAGQNQCRTNAHFSLMEYNFAVLILSDMHLGNQNPTMLSGYFVEEWSFQPKVGDMLVQLRFFSEKVVP
jgi:hypothetical protein